MFDRFLLAAYAFQFLAFWVVCIIIFTLLDAWFMEPVFWRRRLMLSALSAVLSMLLYRAVR